MIDQPNEFSALTDFQEGRVLLFDKPLEWTSFDVVAKVRGILRRALNVKKLKVGHAGTLDPLATGLLIVCTGKLTKRIQFLMDEEKGYTGTMRFGATTPSFDLETEVNGTFSIEHLTPELLTEAAASFQPGYMQTAPAFSAKKVGGKPAYLSARKGRDVEIPPRPVLIDRFALTRIDLPEVDFDVECSKGTYIRSLAYDLGNKVDSGAHLTSLRRYKSGKLHVDQAITIEAFEERIRSLS
jgi:tRNA pseudouridine55 synthase